MTAAITTTSSTLEEQLLEVASVLVQKQLDETANPNGINLISNLNLDVDTLTAQLTASMPFTLGISATGRPEPIVTEQYDVS